MTKATKWYSRSTGSDEPLPPPPPHRPPVPLPTPSSTSSATGSSAFQHVCASVIDHDTTMGHLTTSTSTTSTIYDCAHDEHKTLHQHPFLWAAVGVSQTFLTAIMFGWASLVPVLREEGLDYTPTQLSQIFTCGAVGNYLATLPFGVLLDLQGPKVTGIVASLVYALGLALCSLDAYFYCFAVGFGLVGLARPGIQLPTLHLANLFHGGGGHGGAVYMSCQAAAFDAGTLIFFLFNQGYFRLGLSSSAMFLIYLVVPAWTLATAVFVWPNETLEKTSETDDEESVAAGASTCTSANDEDQDTVVGSPHWSPSDRKRRVSQQQSRAAAAASAAPGRSLAVKKRGLVNAPLSTVLTHVSFYALATWVGIHIFKLNFIVATINDQLLRHFDPHSAKNLIDILGAMLPFGFVVLPIVATMLHTKPMLALQVANVVGILYGAVMCFFPNVAWMQIFVVFPAVATSRQLVYSTLFHTIAKTFGFANYGVLLGLTNAIASLFQMFQTRMVNWSERKDSYFWSNFILLAATFPLLISVLYTDPTWTPQWWRSTRRKAKHGGAHHAGADANEKTSLLQSGGTMEEGDSGGGGLHVESTFADSTTVNSQTSSSTNETASSFRR